MNPPTAPFGTRGESSFSQLQAQVLKAFKEDFGGRPTYFVVAPGRVNVIGEHVDYNEGLVLPAAIDRWMVGAVRARDDRQVRIHDVRFDEHAGFSVDALKAEPGGGWANYVKGVVAGFVARGIGLSGFDLSFASNIPAGGGLSSSAALESMIAVALARLHQATFAPLELALLCQKAEHDYANVPCGLMDQAAVLLSRAGQLLLLDCQSNEIRFCPWSDPAWQLMIVNSGVTHEHSTGEYRKRRESCHAAARLLRVPSLRQVKLQSLDAALSHPELTPAMRRCVRHVVTEIERTQAVVEALLRSDYAETGRLIRASHESLRSDYQVSCAELDFIADTANALDGVAGCRMTGGGFGGCAIVVVRTDAAQTVQAAIEAAYQHNYSRKPAIFLSAPVAGARAWEV